MDADQTYFAGGVGFSRNELAHLPKEYVADPNPNPNLDLNPNPMSYASRLTDMDLTTSMAILTSSPQLRACIVR